MSSSERRREIINILRAKRRVTMRSLAERLMVTTRTIRSDITELSLNYPLFTTQGYGGGVELIDKWGKYQHDITQDQQDLLLDYFRTEADQRKKELLRQILIAHGTQNLREFLETEAV